MNTTRARVLRNGMTEPEIMLWSRLKRLRAQGYHFRRQAPCGAYILDFVSFNHRLVVELDGSHHAEGKQLAHDQIRDAVLQRRGFTVLRFPNAAVRFALSEVVETIMARLADIQPMRDLKEEQPHPVAAARQPPSPLRGREER